MTIADRIRNRRLDLGLSVDDLAKRLQKNRATVYRYESNYIKSYSPDVMEALAKALETTPAYFYGYDEDQQPVSPGSHQSDDLRILVHDLGKLSPEQQRQARQLFRAAFMLTNPELFHEGDDDE